MPLFLQGWDPMLDRRTYTMGASPCPTASNYAATSPAAIVYAGRHKAVDQHALAPARESTIAMVEVEGVEGVVRPISPSTNGIHLRV